MNLSMQDKQVVTLNQSRAVVTTQDTRYIINGATTIEIVSKTEGIIVEFFGTNDFTLKAGGESIEVAAGELKRLIYIEGKWAKINETAIKELTQNEYDQIETPDKNTFYFIKE